MEKLDEKGIYNKIMELKNGNEKDQFLAFKCIGILSNESSKEPLQNRLKIIESLIENHIKKSR